MTAFGAKRSFAPDDEIRKRQSRRSDCSPVTSDLHPMNGHRKIGPACLKSADFVAEIGTPTARDGWWGHALHARHHSDEAAKSHMEEHGKK
jgi:hypothetical protein